MNNYFGEDGIATNIMKGFGGLGLAHSGGYDNGRHRYD